MTNHVSLMYVMRHNINPTINDAVPIERTKPRILSSQESITTLTIFFIILPTMFTNTMTAMMIMENEMILMIFSLVFIHSEIYGDKNEENLYAR